MEFALWALVIWSAGGQPLVMDQPLSIEECRARIAATEQTPNRRTATQLFMACVPVAAH